MKSEQQSIIFFKNKGWSDTLAKKWLREHNLKPIKPVDKQLTGQLRYRLNNPKKYSSFRTIKLVPQSVHMVLGLF